MDQRSVMRMAFDRQRLLGCSTYEGIAQFQHWDTCIFRSGKACAIVYCQYQIDKFNECCGVGSPYADPLLPKVVR